MICIIGILINFCIMGLITWLSDDEDFNYPFFDFTLTTISDGDDCSHLPGWAGRFKIYDDEIIQNILNEWY